MSKECVSLSVLVRRGGLSNGQVARVVGPSGVIGRTRYKEVGSMWRPSSSKFHYVSPDGSFNRRRYLSADTLVVVENGQ